VPSWLELKIPPLLVLFIMAGAMLGVTYAAPTLSFRMPGRTVVALAFATLGVGSAIAGVIAFRQQHTTVNPLTPGASSAIVTGGIYRVSRNPMYLGFLLVLIGGAVYLANAGAALFLPAFVAYLTRYQIQPEERALLAKFGSQYAEYMSRVRRWL
jgi:protein-S-isoprenylcysteine O-methyltransferase Ste14